MTVTQMSEVLGKRVDVTMCGLTVACEIRDAKVSYGRARLLIAPLAGNGTVWIEPQKVVAITDVSRQTAAELMGVSL